MCNSNSNSGFFKMIQGAICGFLNKVFSCGASADSMGDSSSNLGDNTNCSASTQRASFSISNSAVYMSTKPYATLADMTLVAPFSGNLADPIYPPANIQIQSVFPGYGFLPDIASQNTVNGLFAKYAMDEGVIFQACVTPNAPTDYAVFMQVTDDKYYMRKTTGSPEMKYIGDVVKSGSKILPPTDTMIQTQYPGVMLGSGIREERSIDEFFEKFGASGKLMVAVVYDEPSS
jgi:hypothetical protein